MFTLEGVLLNEFQSIKFASDNTNIKLSGISQCLNNRRNSSGGFIWIYKNDFNEKLFKNKVLVCKKYPSNEKKSIRVLKIDVETNEIISEYKSYKEAGRMNYTSDIMIKYACTKSKNNIFNDCKWMNL